MYGLTVVSRNRLDGQGNRAALHVFPQRTCLEARPDPVICNCFVHVTPGGRQLSNGLTGGGRMVPRRG